MKVVAVVPARGGSKGLPGKNLREVAGRSLVGWAVKAGKDARLVDEVYVSSDSDDILHEGSWHGATPLKRPDELATDDAATDDVLVQVGDALAWAFDLMVLLQPTVPYRRAGLVDDCVARLLEADADSLFTARRLHFVWRRVARSKHNGEPVLGGLAQSNCRGARIRRQDFEAADYRWEEDGAVYVCRAGLLQADGTRLGGRIELLENHKAVDIDTEADLAVAESHLTVQAALLQSVTTATV